MKELCRFFIQPRHESLSRYVANHLLQTQVGARER